MELILNISVDVPKNVAGKLSVLYPLLHTLVAYAVEHTEQGEVIVLVQVEPGVADDLCLHFSIGDTGTGQKRVFESMVYERPINGEDKGLAKILSHCAGLATLLSGELWIEVEAEDVQWEEDGCVLHFTVHFQIPQPGHQQPGARILEEVRELPVLVVDDNLSNRNFLVNMLTGWGIQAHSAADGVSALELLHESRRSGNQFWMVLLDASMPGMDGFAVSKQIFEHAGLAKFVLMMTSYEIEGDRALRSREAGVHDQLIKPVLPSELLEAFRYFIEAS